MNNAEEAVGSEAEDFVWYQCHTVEHGGNTFTIKTDSAWAGQPWFMYLNGEPYFAAFPSLKKAKAEAERYLRAVVGRLRALRPAGAQNAATSSRWKSASPTTAPKAAASSCAPNQGKGYTLSDLQQWRAGKELGPGLHKVGPAPYDYVFNPAGEILADRRRVRTENQVYRDWTTFKVFTAVAAVMLLVTSVPLLFGVWVPFVGALIAAGMMVGISTALTLLYPYLDGMAAHRHNANETGTENWP